MRIGRRDFVSELGAGVCAGLGLSMRSSVAAAGSINTVRGPLAPAKLGVTLMHEHVLVDFAGADKIEKGRYDPDEAFNLALPHLKKAYELGCRTLVECTPAYIGRDPVLLRRLSDASGLTLLTNTGYYGAGANKYLPRHAFDESADQLARRWIEEARGGIEGSGIKPGFIKIGVEKGSLSEIHRKLARAAALTHKATGLTIASHTGDGAAALDQLDVLRQEGVAAAAFIWVHAQNESNAAVHIEAARRGAWVEFDGISQQSLDRHVGFVRNMIDQGLVRRTLISMDAGWYHVGEPGGGRYRGYEAVFLLFLPALRKTGAGDRRIRVLMVDNPRLALEQKIRLL